jgi:hypothetical protein
MRLTNEALLKYVATNSSLSAEGIKDQLRRDRYQVSGKRLDEAIGAYVTSRPMRPITRSPYKGMPGFKESGTSKEAGRSLAKNGRADTLRDKCLSIFLEGWQMTDDQVAARLGEDVLSIRPRISELAHEFPPAIRKTELTRIGSRGKPQRVMALNV